MKRFILGISLLLLILTGTTYLLNREDTRHQPSDLSEVTQALDPQTTDPIKSDQETEATLGEQKDLGQNQDALDNQSPQKPTSELAPQTTKTPPATTSKQTPEPAPAPTPAPARTPDPAPTPKPTPQVSNEKQRMLNLINSERGKAGIAPLNVAVKVQEVAQIKAGDMVKNNYFSHTSPAYGSPFDMLRTFGISFSGAAENIALNSSVEAAHSALMASEGHRNNILNPSYNAIGIGMTDGPRGKIFVQMFIKK